MLAGEAERGIAEGGHAMKKWRIEFRYIPPSDYNTPMLYIPLEGTIVEAESSKEAWSKFINHPYAGPPDYYRKENIEEATP